MNIPIVCAGAAVHPGDAIVAYDDGGGVPAAWVRRAADAAAASEAGESDKRAKLVSDVLGLDMHKCASRWKGWAEVHRLTPSGRIEFWYQQ